MRIPTTLALCLFALACRTPEDTKLPDLDEDGYDTSVDCDDDDPAVHPDAEEICNGVDDDCDGEVDTEAVDAGTWYPDMDGDGYGYDYASVVACEAPEGHVADGGDCDDADTAYHPGATEDDCTDPEDYNCDGSVGYEDADRDGWPACEECDDSDRSVHPDALEVCDDIDNDCDGTVNGPDSLDALTFYADADADGYGDASSTTEDCEAPEGYVADDTDCDDAEDATFPGADEYCDGADDDCDGDVDEDEAVDASTWHLDFDGDGYGGSLTTPSCEQPSGYVADDTDCDDGDATSYPGGSEVCDLADNDCNGTVDDGASDALTWYADADSDGYGDPDTTTEACAVPSGYTADDSDCDDSDASVSPAATEHCNEVDDDCDGLTDEPDAVDAETWYADFDGDGFGQIRFTTDACEQPSGYVDNTDDCDDLDDSSYPGGTEVCDEADNDCDGVVDEEAIDFDTFYADADGDGYGDSASTEEACEASSGYVENDDDCDDGDAAVYPYATEVCDGLDNDCDGTADNDEEVLGDDAVCMAASCEEILSYRASATDGAYYIEDDSGVAVEAWCEMDLDGGGWLAVFNWMDPASSSTSYAASLHSAITNNADMSAAVLPSDTSTSIYTSNIDLTAYTEVLYGWAPSSSDDVSRYGTYSSSTSISGDCYVDGYCGANVAIATMDIEPTGSTRTIYTGSSPSYPHVGMGFSGQIIVWGYDRNNSSHGNWANWYDLNSCCNAGNTSAITTSGWRYTTYIR